MAQDFTGVAVGRPRNHPILVPSFPRCPGSAATSNGKLSVMPDIV